MYILYDLENRTALCILGSRLSMPNATILNFGKIALDHFSWRHKKAQKKKEQLKPYVIRSQSWRILKKCLKLEWHFWVFNGAKAQTVLNQEYGAVLSFRTAVWAWLCQAKCFHFLWQAIWWRDIQKFSYLNQLSRTNSMCTVNYQLYYKNNS